MASVIPNSTLSGMANSTSSWGIVAKLFATNATPRCIAIETRSVSSSGTDESARGVGVPEGLISSRTGASFLAFTGGEEGRDQERSEVVFPPT